MKHYKFFVGYGYDKHKLVAFDKALQDAGIGDYNIVKVSSILPPKSSKSESINLEKGSILYAAYSCITINPGEFGSTAVSCASSKDTSLNGVIFEYSTSNKIEDAESTVRDMCKSAMLNRDRTIYKLESKQIRITNDSNKYCSIITGIALW